MDEKVKEADKAIQESKEKKEGVEVETKMIEEGKDDGAKEGEADKEDKTAEPEPATT